MPATGLLHLNFNMDAITQLHDVGPALDVEVETQLRVLLDTGLLLAGERSLAVIAQVALQAGRKLCDAQFGILLYNESGIDGQTCVQYGASGYERPAPSESPPIPVFDPAAAAGGIRRCDDLAGQSCSASTRMLSRMFPKELAIRSLIAAPVHGKGGHLLGELLFAHQQPNHFSASAEPLLATLADQTAAALANVRLEQTVKSETAQADSARQLQRATSERLMSVLESTSDGVILLDRQWHITFLNSRARVMVADGRDATGESFWELFPDARGTAFEQHYRRAMYGGESVEFTEFYLPLDLWVYVHAFPTPEGVAIFFQDVTRHKEAEHERAETTRRLRLALDAGQLGTWSWEASTDLLDFDERASGFYGVRAHTPVSRRWLREHVLLQEDLTQSPSDLGERLRDGGTYSAEYRVHGPEGLRWLAVHGIANYLDGSSQIVGMSGTVQDVTTRKLQEVALRQSEKLAATGRLAATIAHEVNNPLEAVTNLIFLCKTDPGVPGHVQRLLETADQELARVAEIAQQTLGFYRDTARPSEIDLAVLLRSVVDLFARKLLSKKLECVLETPGALHLVGLPGEIKQIFSNLLVNAIDASPPGTKLLIRARLKTQQGRQGISVLVSDHGSGMAEGVRRRIFSPFFTTKESVGTGLGLWVTRGMVEKQGGTIGYRTCTSGATGTVFRVFLPVHPANVPAFDSPQTRILQ